MNEISSYIKLSCAVIIFTGVLMTLIPGGRMKRSFTSLCSIAVVCTMIYPFGIFITEFQGSISNNFSYNEASIEEEQFELDISQEIIAEAIETELKKNNIQSDISLKCTRTADEIVIDTIFCYGSYDEEEKVRIRDIILQSFANSEIIIEEEESA